MTNPPPMIACVVNGEFEIVLPEHRANRPEWYQPHGWEKARMQSMHQHLTKDDTLFYVGAEEGDLAALCAMWVNEIVLFEPNPLVWPNIKAIWEANNLTTPYCISGFASSKTTGAPYLIHGFPVSAEGPMISDHGFKELSAPGDIPQTRIDDVPLIPTAISLDVEGSEFEVLRGAEDTLRKYKPKIWLSGHPEFLFRLYNEYLGDLRNWIKDMGYTEELLAYDHEVHFYYEPTTH